MQARTAYTASRCIGDEPQLPESVIVWKLVVMIVSERRSTARIIANVIDQVKQIAPTIRIDTNTYTYVPINGEPMTAFTDASAADFLVGVIDDKLTAIANEPDVTRKNFLARANRLIDFMNRHPNSEAMFYRYWGEQPDAAATDRFMRILNAYKDDGIAVKSNRDFEGTLYKLILAQLAPLKEISQLRLPSQGAGPHFGLGISGQIAITPIADLDRQGNDLRRIDQLLPLLRECAANFADSSGLLGNQHPGLVRDVGRYRQAISAEPDAINWGMVWGLGVRLEAATAVAERKVADRLAPEMEDEPLAALQSLRNLHAPLILATTEGRELQEQADWMQMTRGQQSALHEAAVALSNNFKQHEEIIEPEAAIVVAEGAETIGAAPHPERGTTYGIATLKNTTIVLFAAALAYTPKFYLGNYLGDAGTMGAWEALKKWPTFSKAAEALGKEFQVLIAEQSIVVQVTIKQLMPFRAFIVANEQHLRGIASATPQLKWLLPYINYIIRTS